MKTITLIICFFILYSATAQNQDSCFVGVYLTLNNFQHNQISNKTNTDQAGNNYKLSADGTVKISSKDAVIKYNADTIYAVNLCGSIYRYSNKGELYAPQDFYKIEDTKGLIIYTSMYWGGKEYFYSTKLNSQIHRLSIKNLSADFANNKEFLAAIKKLKKDYPNGLESKDSDKHFIINQVYNQIFK